MKQKHRMPFPILFEDDDVIVISKPAGLLSTHTRLPGRLARESQQTAENFLNEHVRKGQPRSRKRVWLVHRLDRDTSGVMLFAKSEPVAEKFRAHWSDSTEKIYLARVKGVMNESSGVFESRLAEDRDGYRVRSVKAGEKAGKLARTEWRRLSARNGQTLVEVYLKSGRKNQIRVHFAEAGHPIVGDAKYGGPGGARLLLHAHTLRFRHPRTQKWLSFTSEPPDGLRNDAPAVFFDIDGTLFDTRADLAATVNHTRRDLGLAELPAEEVIAHVGQGARYLLEHAIPEARVPYETLWEKFRSHYAEHCCESVRPYPHVRRTLETLARQGWLMGINTNKPRFAVERILEKFGLARYFGSAIVAGGDGIPLKPDAESLRACAARLGGHRLSARDWMVGDSWTDMEAAANAGVKGAFCSFGFGRLGASRYTVKIDRFDELTEHLKAAAQL